MLATYHPDVCIALTIMDKCKLYCDHFVALDNVSSKITIEYGELNLDDVRILKDALVNFDYLWGKTNLSFYPKIHSAIDHAIEQVKQLKWPWGHPKR